MDAEDSVLSQFISNNGTKGHPFKQVIHLLEDTFRVVNILIETLGAFLTEAKESIYVPILMVASQKENLSGVLELQREQEADDLETLATTINIVAQENVIKTANITCLLRRTPNVKESHQTIVVAVHIAKNLNRRLQLLDKHGLLLEDLHCFVDKFEDVFFLYHE